MLCSGTHTLSLDVLWYTELYVQYASCSIAFYHACKLLFSVCNQLFKTASPVLTHMIEIELE